ncbi:MAG: M48 family metalloprotease [Candidatus Rokubacteria bacterium]|nr:M48 family metalloprotease [Candidatus Rokubacteria bacterium]
MDCPRCARRLDEVYAPEGVVVDFCSGCRGAWYDKGELVFLSKHPRRLKPLLETALLSPKASELACPRCRVPMETGGLGAPDLLVDRCRSCGGLWLDAGERARLDKAVATKLAAGLDRAERVSTGTATETEGAGARPVRIPLPSLPNLALRSTAVLLSLYAMVFLVLLLAVEAFGAGLGLAVLAALAVITVQYLAAPFVMDLFLRHLQSTRWVSAEELPPHLAAFIETICQARKVRFPRVGIIHDGNPNAFTYGHHPGNARLILTSGLIEMLDEDELRAVVGHELGHVLHWDILVMTLASLAPILLYYLYRILGRARSRGKGDCRALVALVCYVFYLISEYLVLFLSRAREYYADRFSGQITRAPNVLARALVKIAYGLAAARPEEAAAKAESPLRAVAPLGIFDPHAALHLAVASGARGFSPEDVVGAMQWDLWNPWAGFYELASTHPLPAKRIKALGDLASHYGERPLVDFKLARPESYWDEFLTDLAVMGLPVLLPAAVLVFLGLGLGAGAYGFAIAAFGIGALVRSFVTYPGGLSPYVSVAGLLKKVKVSAVRAYPVTLTGRIIGRGIPGLIYSEDLVLQDATGFIFLDYRQPSRLLDFWFGLFRTPGLIGQEAVVRGWYRRAPVPYVEMKRIEYAGGAHGCYTYHAKLILALLVIAIGIGVMALG